MTIGLLLLRLVLGLTLAAHGTQKLFGAFGGGGIAGTGAFFEDRLGFKPGRRYAAMAGLTEVGAGLAVALGLFTPVAAAAVIGTMLVAAVAAHGSAGFFITKGGYEYTVVLGSVAAALAFVGPGRLSVDRMLGWDLHGTMWGIAALVFGSMMGLLILAGRTRVGEDEDEPEAEAAGAGAVAGGREAALDKSAPAREQADAEPVEAEL